jgi:hypothetical protein
MKYSFAYEVSIADKLDGKKQGAIEQNSEGFSTISDALDRSASTPIMPCFNRNSIVLGRGSNYG